MLFVFAFLLFGNRVVAQGIWCADYVIAFILGRLVRDGIQEKKALWVTSIIFGGVHSLRACRVSFRHLRLQGSASSWRSIDILSV